MGVLTRFRLDGGTNQQSARKLLPADGLLRRVVNFRLRRDNELGVRPGFTALDMGRYQGTDLVACDLISYDDRLFALGHGASASLANRICLNEYVGAVEGWTSMLGGDRLPNATRVRNIVHSRDQEGGVHSATVAVYNGLGVAAYEAKQPSNGKLFGIAFRASDDATLFESRLTSISDEAQVFVTAGHKFHIVGMQYSVGSPVSLGVYTVDPATDTSFSGASTLQTVDRADIFAAAAVTGSTGGYVTVGCLAGNLVVRHYNDSHVQQMTRTVNTVVPNYLAITADSTNDIIVIGYIDDADDFPKYRTIKLTDGTNIAGPTTITATTTAGALSVDTFTVGSSFFIGIAANITSTTPRKIVTGTDLASGATFTAGTTWHDAQLVTERFDTGINTPISHMFAGFIQGNASTGFGVNVLGVNAGVNLPGWFQDFGTAMEWPLRLGSLTRDSVTGKFYATTRRQNNDLQGTFAVTEFSYGVAERRQTAVQSGLLHIAGGLPLYFDGRGAGEISWGEKPKIYSLASSNTADGHITNSAAYFIQAFAEMVDARGNVHRGPPSDVYPITMGAADDTITGSVSALHSFRNEYLSNGAINYRVVICRTAALADLTAGENLYRETYVTAGTDPTDNWGQAQSFTLTTSDDDLRALGATQGTIYTQGQTPIPHQAPPPFSYCWPTNERVAVGGLPQTNQWLQSKLKFPAEGTQFADADGFAGYQGSTDEAILAVGALGGNVVAFTRRTISLWQGDGPDHSGQGQFTFAGFLSREGGINGVDGWKSLVETDDGLFFQRDDEQICLLSRGGGVDWKLGQAVRDELATYPVVTAACFLRKEYAVAFAVTNSAGNAGEILVLDLRRQVWTIIDVLAIALAEYQGRLCYADASGLVYQQNAAVGAGAMPTQVFETYDFDFGTGLSWGALQNIGIVGTKVDDCTVALAVTYDSGANYTTIETFTVTTAGGYADNAPVELKKALPTQKCARFGLKVTVSGGSDTEGVRINELVLETERMPGMTRLPARDTH